MSTCGIYKITNLVNNKIYIGSAINIEKRWKHHSWLLNNNKHPNGHLQNAWNKYWSVSFKFEILEYCEKENINDREQHWLDFTNCYDIKIGYNILKFANITLGSKRSEETRKKMSAWQIGRIMSDEAKEKMSDAKRKPDKWPHLLGWKCKCIECATKTKNYHRLKAKERRDKIAKGVAL